MTAEIALLNRTGVALAADSAVTTTYWRDGTAHTRYSKSANKIFHISKCSPVGLMIYAAANLQGTPWDIIAKAYRDNRGDNKHGGLDGYATDLFDFIETDGHLFPVSHQDEELVSSIYNSAFRLCIELWRAQQEKKGNAAVKRAAVQKKFSARKREIDRDKFIESVKWPSIQADVDAKASMVMSRLDPSPLYKSILPHIDVDDLIATASRAVFKRTETSLQSTGVAISGYGENEYFPRLLGYRCYGVLLGKLLYDVNSELVKQISPDNVSEIRPIAQSNMVNTFIHGASMAALVEMDDAFEKAMDGLVDRLEKAGHLPTGLDLSADRAAELDTFKETITAHLWKEHTQPLRSVVGMLSIGELAELAETLISIESLKERVTRPTESVSGPIDVAVISKGDGFIWIKRKHYFDIELNPRYISRKP